MASTSTTIIIKTEPSQPALTFEMVCCDEKKSGEVFYSSQLKEFSIACINCGGHFQCFESYKTHYLECTMLREDPVVKIKPDKDNIQEQNQLADETFEERSEYSGIESPAATPYEITPIEDDDKSYHIDLTVRFKSAKDIFDLCYSHNLDFRIIHEKYKNTQKLDDADRNKLCRVIINNFLLINVELTMNRRDYAHLTKIITELFPNEIGEIYSTFVKDKSKMSGKLPSAYLNAKSGLRKYGLITKKYQKCSSTPATFFWQSIINNKSLVIHDLIRSCLETSMEFVMAFHKYHNGLELNEIDRNRIVRALISTLLLKNFNSKLHREDYIVLTDIIIKTFPTESRSTYYVPSCRSVKCTGKLFASLMNYRQTLKLHGLITRRQTLLSEEETHSYLIGSSTANNDIIFDLCNQSSRNFKESPNITQSDLFTELQETQTSSKPSLYHETFFSIRRKSAKDIAKECSANNLYFIMIREKYKKENKLDEIDRNKLVRIIIGTILSDNLEQRFKAQDYIHLAKIILELYPTEQKETYYKFHRNKSKMSGKLVGAVQNYRHELINCELIIKNSENLTKITSAKSVLEKMEYENNTKFHDLIRSCSYSNIEFLVTLYKYYGTRKLNEIDRTRIVKTIINKMLIKNPNRLLNRRDYINLSEIIIKAFPTETQKMYYKPAKNRLKSCGKLVSHHMYFRHLLKQYGIIDRLYGIIDRKYGIIDDGDSDVESEARDFESESEETNQNYNTNEMEDLMSNDDIQEHMEVKPKTINSLKKEKHQKKISLIKSESTSSLDAFDITEITNPVTLTEKKLQTEKILNLKPYDDVPVNNSEYIVRSKTAQDIVNECSRHSLDFVMIHFKYANTNKLDDIDRNKLVRIIVNEILLTNVDQRLNRHEYMYVTKLILELFPTEKEETYYKSARGKTKMSGKLVAALMNYRSSLKQSNLIIRQYNNASSSYRRTSARSIWEKIQAENSLKFDGLIKECLNSSIEFLMTVFQYFTIKKKLDDNDRNRIVKVIMAQVLLKNHSRILSRREYIDLSKIITKTFPNETKEVYYTPAVEGLKASGKLLSAAMNFRATLKLYGLIQRLSKKAEKSYDDLEQEDNDNPETNNQFALIDTDEKLHHTAFKSEPYEINENVKEFLEPLQFKCYICDKSFDQISTLQTHELIMHKTFTCNICDQNFDDRSALKEHSRTIHFESDDDSSVDSNIILSDLKNKPSSSGINIASKCRVPPLDTQILAIKPNDVLMNCLRHSVEFLIINHKYDTNKVLEDADRSKIAKIIITELMISNLDLKLSRTEYYHIADLIVKLFPNEKKETYYTPHGTNPKGTPARYTGKLISALHNTRTQLIKYEIINKFQTYAKIVPTLEDAWQNISYNNSNIFNDDLIQSCMSHSIDFLLICTKYQKFKILETADQVKISKILINDLLISNLEKLLKRNDLFMLCEQITKLFPTEFVGTYFTPSSVKNRCGGKIYYAFKNYRTMLIQCKLIKKDKLEEISNSITQDDKNHDENDDNDVPMVVD